ncbi:phage head closure protein [Croceicoccus gelatinilyticus]|uniref:phage head closure protein n=1 Tax=Croceicoccus gelatinilyticus TaxID=2835536 RepID=UPI001BCAD696|nr:phage head closure protein [Croceicoccus gelatinilyticus]MBS7668864.1 phage head closure protein [Croceicoccus gelatinilyticus]
MAKSPVSADKLKERVTIKERVGTQDPTFGTWTYSWEELATVWAEVQDVLPSRSERVADGITIANRPARIRMRYREDVDSTMRFEVNGRTLHIIAGPAELGFRQGVEFVAEELTTAGEEA